MVWIIFLSCSLPLGYLETVLISNRLGECKSFSAVPGRRRLPRYSGLNFSCIIQKLWRPHCHAEPILWPRPVVSAHSHRHHRTGCCRTKNIWPCSSFVPTHHFPTLNVWCSFYFLLGSKAINSSLRLHPIPAPVPAGRNNSDLCGIWLHWVWTSVGVSRLWPLDWSWMRRFAGWEQFVVDCWLKKVEKT